MGIVITEIEIYLKHSHRTNELTVSFIALLSHPTHIQYMYNIMIYSDEYFDLVTLSYIVHVILCYLSTQMKTRTGILKNP